ncbi:HNH endonuclease [Achromobacter xylosoxidans]|uniref:HNH endonuclease n=1 Tax=Alcaligenes xylosoxydans xylosoxydans TaxID=85698 RepID=UPI003BA8BA9E
MKSFDFLKEAVEAEQESCIEWPFSRDKDGYGWCNFGKQKRAHRAAFLLSKGVIPKGMHVMHSCDNPSCINPRHLALGTPRENSYDSVRKGRAAIRPGGANVVDNKGEKHGNSKLTDDLVKQIRSEFQSGKASISQVARSLGLGRQTIGDVIHKKTWTHVN